MGNDATLAGMLEGAHAAQAAGSSKLDYFVRPGARPLIITGAVGSGKSFLAAGLLCRALPRRPRIAVVDCDGAYRSLAGFLNAGGAGSAPVHWAEPTAPDYGPSGLVDLTARQRRLIDDDGASDPAFKILLVDAPWHHLTDDAVSRHLPALAQLWHERNGLLIVVVQYSDEGAPRAEAARRLVDGFPERLLLANPAFGPAAARLFNLRPGVYAEGDGAQTAERSASPARTQRTRGAHRHGRRPRRSRLLALHHGGRRHGGARFRRRAFRPRCRRRRARRPHRGSSSGPRR